MPGNTTFVAGFTQCNSDFASFGSAYINLFLLPANVGDTSPNTSVHSPLDTGLLLIRTFPIDLERFVKVQEKIIMVNPARQTIRPAVARFKTAMDGLFTSLSQILLSSDIISVVDLASSSRTLSRTESLGRPNSSERKRS